MNRRVAIAVALVLVGIGAVGMIAAGAKATPALNISFLHYEHHREATYAVVEIRNEGSGTACFYGYGGDSPFYQVMVEHGKGWTNTPNQFWCGTGAAPGFIPPGRSKTVRVFLPTNQTWKVGVTFRKPTLEDRLPRFVAHRLPRALQSQATTVTAWSPQIPYSKAQ